MWNNCKQILHFKYIIHIDCSKYIVTECIESNEASVFARKKSDLFWPHQRGLTEAVAMKQQHTKW